jgi:hypothetical protein
MHAALGLELVQGEPDDRERDDRVDPALDDPAPVGRGCDGQQRDDGGAAGERALIPPSLAGADDGIALVPIRAYAPTFEVSVPTPTLRRPSAAARAFLEVIAR